MGISLLALKSLYKKNPAAFRERFSEPMLVWAQPAEPRKGEFIPMATMGVAPMSSPRLPNPTAWPVQKAPDSSDGMSVVTVGRSSGADINIDHKGVSRMHAFFMRDPKTKKWRVSDATSRNGTFVDNVRITPGIWVDVPDRVIIGFGNAR